MTPRSIRAGLLLAITGASVAPDARAQPLPPLDEYHVRAFGPREGLLAADVRGIAQTRDGYLYVASTRGLTRFDGVGFDRVALPEIQTELIEFMHADRQERLWLLGRERRLLGYVADQRFHALPRAPVQVGILSETADGQVWFGSDQGLLQVTPGAEAPFTLFTTADGLPSDTTWAVFDLQGRERIAITSQGAARLVTDPARPGGRRFEPVAPRVGLVEASRADSRGSWLRCQDARAGACIARYHEGRLELLDPARDELAAPLDGLAGSDRAVVWTSISLALPIRDAMVPDGDGAGREGLGHVERAAARAPRGAVRRALRARDGTVWLAFLDRREGRDVLFRHRDGRLEPVPLRPHLDYKDINHLLEDREGSVWVGTDRGLVQLAPRRVFALTARDGLAEGFTVPVLQTRDGALWVGTWGGGLHRFADGRLERRYTMADGLPDDRIRALHEARDGTLRVGTARGFAAIRDGRLASSESSGDEVRAFAEDPDGALWIATDRRLLVRTGRSTVEHRPGFWSRRNIWALHPARDGALWIASEQGLFRLAGDSLRPFGEDDGLRSPFTVAIHEEADGTLWVSTYAHGLYRWRGGRFAGVGTREGLHHEGVWRMLEDGRGGVWMSSDGGVFRVEHSRLHAVADAVERGESPAERLAPLVFTEAEGMPSRESNRASPGGWRLRDGRLVFNNLAGVVVIEPTRATVPAAPPPVALRAVVADGHPVPLRASGRSTLPPGTKQLSFEFAALAFVAPEQGRYRYRLDGYDDDWVAGGRDRRASYTNLPPGHYTFHVQSASGIGAWSEPGVVHTLTVLPFFWQAWSFRLLTVAVVAGLLSLAYRYRVARLLEMERLRVRIASDLHDDVGSSLSSIALMSEMLQGRPRADALEQRQLARINRAAEETIGALRDIIWLVDPKHGGLADLLGRMRGVAGDLLNGTAWTFDVTGAGDSRPLEMAFMRNVLLIHKEALHNVVRHARASRVHIRAGEERGRFVLRIEDDGVGFDARDVRLGHGLESMRRRAQQVGGHLDIASAPQRGTRITFSARMA